MNGDKEARNKLIEHNLRLVAHIVKKYDIKVPLGIIPAGTSNDFAKHIKMPASYMQCIDKIIEGKII